MKTKMKITVGARASDLSKAQVAEVLQELCALKGDCVEFEGIFLQTIGDKDLKTSLRTLDKTNFFTKEIDDLLLSGKCRIAIHSAKDLPEPLPEGLEIVALTKGVDSSDVLVMRNGESIDTLPANALIATSSERREEAVKMLRSDFTFRDLRGAIPQRLIMLHLGEADGVVVAEAALIRLGLTHYNRVKLPGETATFQGRLAVLARSDDLEMKQLFKCMDNR